MKKVFFLFLLIPIISNSQHSHIETASSAVHWSGKRSWEEVKEQAKTENKYIFLDLYATWCVPCKKMDKEVYTNDSVGKILNDNFISVKVQVDTTKNDDEITQSWYNDAQLLYKKYKVSYVPTLLVFTPDGEVASKAGYLETESFVSFTQNALNPKKQYSTLVRAYNNGQMEKKDMPDLVINAQLFEDDTLAHIVAMDYVDNYLMKLPKKGLLTHDNISFITTYVFNPKKDSFKFIFKNPKEVNKVLQKSGFAEDWVHYIITINEIEPLVKQLGKTEPDWVALESTIKKKYSEYYAKRTILDAKSRWYMGNNWPEYTRNTIAYIQTYKSNMDEFELAQNAWRMFLVAEKEEELKAAKSWAEKIIKSSKDSSNVLPAAMDTYANIIYKMDYLFNNIKSSPRAIAIEEKALLIAKEHKVQSHTKSLTKMLEKMKLGEITWKLPENFN